MVRLVSSMTSRVTASARVSPASTTPPGSVNRPWAGVRARRTTSTCPWRTVRAIVFKSPYPTAPFSTLYLFARGQDIGFQKAIDDSPRKRHHVRFWAMRLAGVEDTLGTADFWLNTDRPAADARVLWVGAGTKDTGLSFTRLTFQIRSEEHTSELQS